jgi:hypothetical protein
VLFFFYSRPAKIDASEYHIIGKIGSEMHSLNIQTCEKLVDRKEWRLRVDSTALTLQNPQIVRRKVAGECPKIVKINNRLFIMINI